MRDQTSGLWVVSPWRWPPAVSTIEFKWATNSVRLRKTLKTLTNL